MRRLRCRPRFPATLLLVALAAVPLPAAAQIQPPVQCTVIDINRIGWERLTQAKAVPEVEWWVEADAELLACGREDASAALAEHGFRVVAVYPWVEPDRLRLARGLEPAALRDLGATVLVSSGAGAVLLFEHGQPPPLVESPSGQVDSRALLELPRPTVLARQLANDLPRPSQPPTAELRTLVDEVNAQRWFGDLSTLASYDRYTLGPGILPARDWIVQQLQAMPGLAVTTPSFSVYGTTAYNVVATLPGALHPDDWYIVGGHYDSTSENPNVSAPGAEDNASGCAGVLEMARIFTAHQMPSTMIFICWAGEEQGLYGSEDHAQGLVDSGDDVKVKGVLDMDMIGFTEDADLDCLLESRTFAASLVDAFAEAASQFTTLRIVTSTNAWGSDHVPYLDRGMKALLTIENDWDSYPYYHTTQDLPANITLEMGRQVLRMNVGALAELAGAESSALFSDRFESGDTSAWSAVEP